jgi:hypothetical protein
LTAQALLFHRESAFGLASAFPPFAAESANDPFPNQ